MIQPIQEKPTEYKMLEKIGLPPKPSLRGNTWVVDASHCQGCTSQFSFINRKHHCRRCGGIFCNSCTQQRMLLRGQGDSPVRICEPCKKLEEAARFEMRYGHKNRAGKGGSRLNKKEDEIVNQNLGSEDIFANATSSTASSSNNQELASQDEEGNIDRNLSLDHPSLLDVESATPEDLRQQAAVEKQKHRTLKAEGKSEEALRAFKRGKELERQAAALEISLRKNRRKALSSNGMTDKQKVKDDFKSSGENSKLPIQKSKDSVDLASELKELGWSDADLRDAEKRTGTMSLEGELSSLLKEVSQKPNKEKATVGTDKSQVIAHKKKALELKREGNLAEAKEELKKAKLLERKIEEEELLGEADESDDELSSLIRNMDSDESDDFSKAYTSNINFDYDNLAGISDDLNINENFEVTDEDMYDPEIAGALKSLGWTEDANPEDLLTQNISTSRESLQAEVQSLKREALNQKRAGNTGEAMTLLKKAKLLEKDLESSDLIQKGSISQYMEQPVVSGMVNESKAAGSKLAAKSKMMIQKDLIALKKKALTLRREGRLDEAEEELKAAKVLEEQLEEMNKAPSVTQLSHSNKHLHDATAIDTGDDEDVTDKDMNDPTYLSFLKNLGWEDEDNENISSTTSKENDRSLNHSTVSSVTQLTPHTTGTSGRSKSEIQRELLGLKRKARALRQQGEAEEADAVLKMASSLEAQLQEFESPAKKNALVDDNLGNTIIDTFQSSNTPLQVDSQKNHNEHPISKDEHTLVRPKEIVQEDEKPSSQESNSTAASASQHDSVSFQQQILSHKKKAVMLKREGKLSEAKEELRLAKLLEKRKEETPEPSNSSGNTSSSDVSSAEKKVASPNSVSKPLSSRDRFKLQQESLGHKRQALKLRREGRTAEADAEFELAKALESQLEELAQNDSKGAEPVDDVGVEDFLDPQLLSALRSIGLEDTGTRSHGTEVPQSSKPVMRNVDNASDDREQLAERIKAEKVKAVNLKKAGKQAEALDALRRAKLYEKKLQSLAS